MIAILAPRILALPADVRAALARADGPGWYFSRRDGAATLHDCAPYVRPEPMGERWRQGFIEAWWGCNPAASVAAVTGWPVGKAHELLYDAWCRGESDDHTAALSIIEAHVAGRSENV